MHVRQLLSNSARVASPFACASLLTAAFALLFPASADAQARGTTTQGMFGSSQVGNPGGASASGTGTGMTMGQGSTNGNASTPNNTNGGSSALGNSLGLGANMQNFTPGGSTGFVGANSNSYTNLNSRQGTPGAVQAGRVNFGTLTNLMNQSRQNQFNQQQAQKASRTANQPQGQFRVPLRLGFQPQAIQQQRFDTIVGARITKIAGLSRVGSINASLEGRTAVLRGTVPTEADRQLAEGLARLEPEVMAVRNELVVGPPTSTEEALPLTSPASAR
jgi:osmotically-inducible protein OsmY